MRPDRLVVGEVRGAEVREMLAALNTGHDGGCGTLHANTAADVVARFEALGALAGLGPTAVHAQLLSAVQVVVHVRRSSGRRFVDTVAVLARGVDGRPEVRSALGRGANGRTAPGPAWRVLASLLNLQELPDLFERPDPARPADLAEPPDPAKPQDLAEPPDPAKPSGLAELPQVRSGLVP
jgi:pilus assembly protein CpaF